MFYFIVKNNLKQYFVNKFCNKSGAFKKED